MFPKERKGRYVRKYHLQFDDQDWDSLFLLELNKPEEVRKDWKIGYVTEQHRSSDGACQTGSADRIPGYGSSATESSTTSDAGATSNLSCRSGS